MAVVSAKKTKPVKIVKPVIVDQRRSELAKIDAEIERLAAQVVEKSAALDADVQKHITAMDHHLQQRLDQQIVTLRGRIAKLHEQRFSVELGDLPPPPPLHRPSTAALPTVDMSANFAGMIASATDAGERKFFSDLRAEFEQICKAAKLTGTELVKPPTLRHMLVREAALLVGVHDGMKKMLARIETLESRPALEYRGIWKADTKYEHGAIVTHDGSAWHAEVGSTAILPGDGNCWKLMVKRGKDARP